MGFSVVVVTLLHGICLFKVWSKDKLNKKFVVAEIFAELVSKGIKVLLRRNFHFFFSNRFSQKCEIQMQTKGNYHESRPT